MSLPRIASIVLPPRGRRAVVLCAGPSPAAACLQDWLATADLFLCTDAAGLPYDWIGRSPDVVVGDFDSLQGRLPPPGPDYRHDPDQETTDAEKALRHALADGCGEIVLLGAVGGRVDHSWYNCDLLLRYRRQASLALADDHGVTVPLGPGTPVRWDLPGGTVFSLLPHGGAARVTVEHAVYPLADAELAPGRLVSVSNRVTRPPLRITVHEGDVLATVLFPTRGVRP